MVILMEISFQCRMKLKNRTETWNGKITNIIAYGKHYELNINSRSGFSIIIGESSTGNFACIPSFEAGCELANLKDIFWNTERLTAVLGKVDGITVAYALNAVADHIDMK